jgi:HK97 family phage major capsid protein
MQKKIVQRVTVKSITSDKQARKIKAVISSDRTDRDSEIVDIQSLKFNNVDGMIDLPLQVDHSWSVKDTIGSADSLEIIDNELVAEFRFADGIPLADNVYNLIEQGHLKNAFSIGFMADPESSDNGVFRNAELIETSVVMKGSNYDARVLDILKSKSLTSGELKDIQEGTKEMAEDEKQATEEVTEVEDKESTNEDTEATNKDVEETTDETSSVEEKEEDKQEEVTEVEENNNVEEKTQEALESVISAAVDKAVSKLVEKAQKETPAKQDIEVKSQTESIDKEAPAIKTYKHLQALATFDHETVRKYNKSNLDALKKKGYDYTPGNGVELIACPEFNGEVAICRDELSNLVNYVKVRNLTSSNEVRYVTRDNGFNLLPVDDCVGDKTVTQNSFTQGTAKVYEWAGISISCDNLAEDIVVNWYDQFVQDVAHETVRVENNVILSYDGTGHTGGVATGVLAMPSLVTIAGAYDSTIATTLATTACQVCDCADGIYVMNRCTWGKLKAIQAVDGHLFFGTPMDVATMNTLFGRPVVVVGNSEMPDDLVIFGDFKKYELLRKGTVEIVPNRLGVAGGINLYETDQTALRAKIRRGGFTSYPSCFVAITLA